MLKLQILCIDASISIQMNLHSKKKKKKKEGFNHKNQKVMKDCSCIANMQVKVKRFH